MEVEPFLLPAALNLMVAQRLMPKLCQKCLAEKEVTPEIQKMLDVEIEQLSAAEQKNMGIAKPYKLYESKGCDACNGKGISGRIAIFEMLQMTHEMSRIVNGKATENEIIEEAKRQKMITLRQDGIAKALKGLVSLNC